MGRSEPIADFIEDSSDISSAAHHLGNLHGTLLTHAEACPPHSPASDIATPLRAGR